MGTIILIVSAILIALIVFFGARYKRRLRKQYQEQPYQSVTGTDLEAEMNGRNAYGNYLRRQDRLTMLVKALCAGVVVVAGLVYFSVNWWQKNEPKWIVRAEQKNIEKTEPKHIDHDEQGGDTEFQQWKAKRIAKAQQKVDETWKKYQELVKSKTWLDSLSNLEQQRDMLEEQVETYKNKFYKLSSQSDKLISDDVVEEYQLTLEKYKRQQTKLDKQIKQYNERKKKLLGSSRAYYKYAVGDAYDAFEKASERLAETKALTPNDMEHNNSFDDYDMSSSDLFMVSCILLVGFLGVCIFLVLLYQIISKVL